MRARSSKVGSFGKWLYASALAAAVGTSGAAHASGPVERFMQVLVNPGVPEALVVRYAAGAGSHGYMISRDGGQTFQLMCSAIVALNAPDNSIVERISQRTVPMTAATALDQTGSLMFAQYGSSYVDDGTGCSWSDIPALQDTWPLGLKVDPRDAGVLWSAVGIAPPMDATGGGKLELWRRGEDKAWSSVGPVLTVDPTMGVSDATVAVFANEDVRRIYVSVAMQGRSGTAGYVLSSEDDGATWTQRALPKEQERLNLLAVDPIDPNVLLAVLARDGSADTLLLSSDGGATFETYLEPRAVSGVTFDRAGRLFVADAGDASSTTSLGGLYVATRTGEPLTPVPNTSAADCVHYDAVGDRLLMCSVERFGVVDPQTGAMEDLMRLDQVDQFISCPGRDMEMVCKDQLNAGPSWCCAGHYPFTPICDGYDVTMRADGARVFCGLAGRDYDSADGGAGPDADGDASVRPPDTSDAGDAAGQPPRRDGSVDEPDTEAVKKSDGGCALGAHGRYDALGLLLGLAALLRRRRA